MRDSKTASKNSKYMVVKSNELIRNSRYNFSLQQQKIILYIISKIKPGEAFDSQLAFRISVPELCNTCGIECDKGGYYYKAIKDDLLALTQRNWGMEQNGTIRTYSWISDAEITPGDSTVTVTFSPAMAPYLFELKKDYTQYELRNVLTLKGIHTIRIYEICRSYIYKVDSKTEETTVAIQIDDLRSILQLEQGYKNWADIKRYILDRAVSEINSSTDIHVEYIPIKKGNKVVQIDFFISKATYVQQLEAERKQKAIIEKNEYMGMLIDK